REPAWSISSRYCATPDKAACAPPHRWKANSCGYDTSDSPREASRLVRALKNDGRTGNISPKFYRILKKACERAGVPYGRNTPNGLVLHDARQTATTHLLENNVNPKTVQEWMGWSDKALVLCYSHSTKKSREQAGPSLEELAGRRTA